MKTSPLSLGSLGLSSKSLFSQSELDYRSQTECLDDNFLASFQDEKRPSDQEILNWLQIFRSSNIGAVTFFKLLKIFGSTSAILENFTEIQQSSARKIVLYSRFNAERELQQLRNFGGDIILHIDPLFPKMLKTIYDCPPLISVKGNLDFLSREKIAVVGPRNGSANGLNIAKKMASTIGANNFLTVSGMARGIDAAVHESSVLTGTVAVLAGGIDNIYPPQNLDLYRQISKFGLLISEMPFGYVPKAINFVQRNRIVSGLAKAVLVVEASLRSGSLITARFASEQGREVLVVPGSPFDSRNQGSNRLIRDGATIITSLEDFDRELKILRKCLGSGFCGSDAQYFQNPEANCKKIMTSKEVLKNAVEIADDLDSKKVHRDAKVSDFSLKPGFEEKKPLTGKIFDMLNADPITIDELVELLPDFVISQINIAISELELDGKILISGGKISRAI